MNSERSQVPDEPPEDIATVIARYRASGLGLKAFAREQGLPAGRLHYWIYQKHRGTSSNRRSTPARPAFREIQLPPPPEACGSWAAEVRLPQGIAVRFNASARAEWIGSVVHALQRPC